MGLYLIDLIKNKIDNFKTIKPLPLCFDDFALYMFYVIMVDKVGYLKTISNIMRDGEYQITKYQKEGIESTINNMTENFVKYHYTIYNKFEDSTQ
jgi:hypothetical protein